MQNTASDWFICVLCKSNFGSLVAHKKIQNRFETEQKTICFCCSALHKFVLLTNALKLELLSQWPKKLKIAHLEWLSRKVHFVEMSEQKLRIFSSVVGNKKKTFSPLKQMVTE